MHVWKSRTVIASALLVLGLVTLSGCGVVRDTVEGMSGQEPTSQPSTPSSTTAAGEDDLIVTITVESDADTTGELSVNIDSPGDGQSLREDSVRLPFARDFNVPTDAMFPLRATHVEVKTGPAATYIQCTISVDGQVVATHRAEGSAATATCHRKLQLGPS